MPVETPSLLITDDDQGFRQTLQGVFEPQGFRTILAGDGEEALQIVRQQDVHVVLLDMHMPRLSGLETIRQLKQFRATLPCILMSADLDDFVIDEARRLQAYSVLPKPVSSRQLTGIVRQALERTYNWRLEITIRTSFQRRTLPGLDRPGMDRQP
jgi:CheY-like chemotaxis protein